MMASCEANRSEQQVAMNVDSRRSTCTLDVSPKGLIPPAALEAARAHHHSSATR